MLFDFSTLSARDRYKLLVNLVVPRPIAWVTTLSADGQTNAAPFSFFNCFGDDPPTLAIGVRGKRPGELNDTGENIRATGEFVVNLVGEDNLERMNVTAIEFPRDVDEVERAGLTTRPSHFVKPHRIAESPAAFECQRLVSVDLGPTQSVIFGRVLAAHVRDDVVIDPDRCYVDTVRMGVVGRAYGTSRYVRMTDLIHMPRLPNPE